MTKLFKRLADDTLAPVAIGKLKSEELIERWLAAKPELLDLDILVIARQLLRNSTDVSISLGSMVMVVWWSSSSSETALHAKIVAQIIDYASWVHKLTPKDIHEIAQLYLGKRLNDAFAERFGSPVPDKINDNHSMVIVASSFDASSQRIVRYLSEVHDVAINTAFFSMFEDGDQQFLATDWLLDQEEVASRSETKQRSPWSGLWYVNVTPDRSWDDMRRYGFVAAGGGEKYSAPLRRLEPGSPIVVYQKKVGYLGYGTVISGPVMARDFMTPSGPIVEKADVYARMKNHGDDPALSEYLVAVKWRKTLALSEAKPADGLFRNQNIVCKLRDIRTLEFLRAEFGIDQ